VTSLHKVPPHQSAQSHLATTPRLWLPQSAPVTDGDYQLFLQEQWKGLNVVKWLQPSGFIFGSPRFLSRHGNEVSSPKGDKPFSVHPGRERNNTCYMSHTVIKISETPTASIIRVLRSISLWQVYINVSQFWTEERWGDRRMDKTA
jgi:hypothetical protein